MLLLTLGLYAWFGIVKPDQEKSRQQIHLLPENFPESLQSFQVTTGDLDVTIENREGIWWVQSPNEYLANQEYVEKSLRIMKESVAHHHFPLEKDRFGLQPGKAFLRLQFAEGYELRLQVGEVEGPADTIYILNLDSQEVFVVHNVWAQLIYYPLKQYYHPYLPIPGSLVKDMTLLKNGELQWRVEPADFEHLNFIFKDKSLLLPKANALWFFKEVREFPVENLQFQASSDFIPFWELKVSTDKGNIIFEFDEAIDKLQVKRFNIFANVKPYSLNSLGYEIEKVFKSDKK